MIHIKRPKHAPSSLKKVYSGRVKSPKIPGKTETETVIKRYTDYLSSTQDKQFQFKYERYSDREVNAALRNLFHGKCAYCESRYAATQPMDIEHWRPKGEIKEHVPNKKPKSIKPGYYWLAADWSNLLPSCIDCNRGRTQVDKFEGTEVVLGKQNQFPLEKPDKRVRSHENFDENVGKSEGPLLINPCDEDPEDFFRYDEQGLILPKFEDENSIEHKRAMASIRVYALNRADLVAERRQVIITIDLRLELIGILGPIRKKLKQLAKKESDIELGIQAEAITDLIASEISVVQAMKKKEQPFAGLARQFIDEIDSM